MSARSRALSDGTVPPLTPIDVPFKEQQEVGAGPYDWLEASRDAGGRVDAWVSQQSNRTTAEE